MFTVLLKNMWTTEMARIFFFGSTGFCYHLCHLSLYHDIMHDVRHFFLITLKVEAVGEKQKK